MSVVFPVLDASLYKLAESFDALELPQKEQILNTENGGNGQDEELSAGFSGNNDVILYKKLTSTGIDSFQYLSSVMRVLLENGQKDAVVSPMLQDSLSPIVKRRGGVDSSSSSSSSSADDARYYHHPISFSGGKDGSFGQQSSSTVSPNRRQRRMKLSSSPIKPKKPIKITNPLSQQSRIIETKMKNLGEQLHINYSSFSINNNASNTLEAEGMSEDFYANLLAVSQEPSGLKTMFCAVGNKLYMKTVAPDVINQFGVDLIDIVRKTDKSRYADVFVEDELVQILSLKLIDPRNRQYIAAGYNNGWILIFDTINFRISCAFSAPFYDDSGYGDEDEDDEDYHNYRHAIDNSRVNCINVSTDMKTLISTHKSGLLAVFTIPDLESCVGVLDRTPGRDDGEDYFLGFIRTDYVHAENKICNMAWNCDGTLLAVGGNDNQLSIWDMSQFKPLPLFLPTRKYMQRSVCPYGLEKPIYAFFAHIAGIKAISWHPTIPHILATGGGTADKKIKIWNLSKTQDCSGCWNQTPASSPQDPSIGEHDYIPPEFFDYQSTVTPFVQSEHPDFRMRLSRGGTQVFRVDEQDVYPDGTTRPICMMEICTYSQITNMFWPGKYPDEIITVHGYNRCAIYSWKVNLKAARINLANVHLRDFNLNSAARFLYSVLLPDCNGIFAYNTAHKCIVMYEITPSKIGLAREERREMKKQTKKELRHSFDSYLHISKIR
jgi:hypothetical protein